MILGASWRRGFRFGSTERRGQEGVPDEGTLWAKTEVGVLRQSGGVEWPVCVKWGFRREKR